MVSKHDVIDIFRISDTSVALKLSESYLQKEISIYFQKLTW